MKLWIRRPESHTAFVPRVKRRRHRCDYFTGSTGGCDPTGLFTGEVFSISSETSAFLPQQLLLIRLWFTIPITVANSANAPDRLLTIIKLSSLIMIMGDFCIAFARVSTHRTFYNLNQKLTRHCDVFPYNRRNVAALASRTVLHYI
jgi:hypothetical protein